MSDLDLKITGGTLIDGTGSPRRRADVGVKDGRVVALGDGLGAARQTLDAQGLVVSPGFVDIHTHYDAQVLWDSELTVSPWHGVTTAVLGNCGFGVAPTRPEHRDLILRTLERVEGMSLSALEEGLGSPWPFQSFPEYMDLLERAGVGVDLPHAGGVIDGAERIYAVEPSIRATIPELADVENRVDGRRGVATRDLAVGNIIVIEEDGLL